MATNKDSFGPIVGGLEDKVKDLNRTMAVVVIVLLLGFATMFVALMGLVFTYQDNSRNANQQLRDEVKTQNDKIDALTKELQKPNE